MVDQEGVERGRLPVHLLRRGHLEHDRALLGPVQRRVGLVPHVVDADERAGLGQRVPRLPGQERVLRHARRGADDQAGHHDGDAHPDDLRIAGERAAAALRGRDEHEQRQQQEEAGAEGVGVQRQHGAREREQGERDPDPGQSGLAPHDQPRERCGGREERELQVVVGAGEAAGVDRRVRAEPLPQAVADELRDTGRIQPVSRLPRPHLHDLADRGERGDEQREQRGGAPAAEHRDDRGQRGEQRQHGEIAEAHVRLREPRPVPAAEHEEAGDEQDRRDPDRARSSHVPPPAAGPAPRAPGRRGHPRGSGPPRCPSG